MGFNQIMQMFNALPEPLGQIIGTVVAVTLIVVPVVKSLKTVPQGNKAMRVRWGKVRQRRDGSITYLEPGGPKLLIPFVDNLLLVSDRDRTVAVPATEIPYGDKQYRVDGSVTYAVNDIYKVEFAVDKFDVEIASVTSSALRQALLATWREQGTTDEPSLDRLRWHFERLSAIDTARLGVSVRSLLLTSFSVDGQLEIARAISSFSPEQQGAIAAVIDHPASAA